MVLQLFVFFLISSATCLGGGISNRHASFKKFSDRPPSLQLLNRENKNEKPESTTQ